MPGSDDPRDTARHDLGVIRHDLEVGEAAAQHRATEVLDDHPGAAPVVSLLGRVIREQSAEQVGLAASGAAFWLVIAAFPAAIAAVSVFGLVVDPRQVAKDLEGLANNGPDSLGSTLTQQLHKVAAADHVGLSVGLGVSVIFALWSASAGVYNLDRAIRTAYGLPPSRYLRARGRALAGALVVVLVLGVIALLSEAAAAALRLVPIVVAIVFGVPILLAIVAGVIAAAYRFSTGRLVGGRRVMPGAVTAAVGLLVVAAGFTAYLQFSTRYTAVYGALAGAVIGMTGTYLATYVVLIGAVINAQIDQR